MGDGSDFDIDFPDTESFEMEMDVDGEGGFYMQDDTEEGLGDYPGQEVEVEVPKGDPPKTIGSRYPCTSCEKTFITPDHLKLHQIIHSADKDSE
jgi:hypothetical protein